MDKSRICFVKAKYRWGDYVFTGLERYGYQVLIPYTDYDLLMRCLREAWFRLHLPGRSIWYNKKISGVDADVFIVLDPLIVPEFLQWLERVQPSARLILKYDNRAGTTLSPALVGDRIEKWSYNKDDCREYGMRYEEPNYIELSQPDPTAEKQLDVLYLGRDKGRAEELLALRDKLGSMGLRASFRICPDRAYQLRKKPFYQPAIPYEEYLEQLKKSRAVLNVMPEGQTSLTLREMEAAFFNVKCITTNKGIKDFSLYSPQRYFILGEDDPASLAAFVKADDLTPVPQQVLDRYRFDGALARMLASAG